jgi:hypothetical protein
MEVLTKIFLFVIFILLLFIGYLFTVYYRGKKISRIKKVNSSLAKLKGLQKFNFLEENEVKEILSHFRVIFKLVDNSSVFLYLTVRGTLNLALENKEVYCLVSKKTAEEMMRFVYEKTLKPHILICYQFIF